VESSRNRVRDSVRAREGWLALWAECMSDEWRPGRTKGGRGDHGGGGVGLAVGISDAPQSQGKASAGTNAGQETCR
jgi:hypothetical protein